jgi:hypothetical protein
LPRSFSEHAQRVIEAAVAEAERGYDLDFLKAHECKVGRPLSVGTHAAVSAAVLNAPSAWLERIKPEEIDCTVSGV